MNPFEMPYQNPNNIVALMEHARRMREAAIAAGWASTTSPSRVTQPTEADRERARQLEKERAERAEAVRLRHAALPQMGPEHLRGLLLGTINPPSNEPVVETPEVQLRPISSSLFARELPAIGFPPPSKHIVVFHDYKRDRHGNKASSSWHDTVIKVHGWALAERREGSRYSGRRSDLYHIVVHVLGAKGGYASEAGETHDAGSLRQHEYASIYDRWTVSVQRTPPKDFSDETLEPHALWALIPLVRLLRHLSAMGR